MPWRIEQLSWSGAKAKKVPSWIEQLSWSGAKAKKVPSWIEQLSWAGAKAKNVLDGEREAELRVSRIGLNSKIGCHSGPYGP
ncbi:hypothetical protein [Cohnella sp. WQ 127256]|uniref:hypothetical protein n=1 Tax=Cohnella sp. WQ 127256 TaxID=2938790 RepID=UPI0021182A01|nr:hypothetical protein [Cohnella sp. WQ 127256]